LVAFTLFDPALSRSDQFSKISFTGSFAELILKNIFFQNCSLFFQDYIHDFIILNKIKIMEKFLRKAFSMSLNLKVKV
jgi:hypothetical protein